MLQDNNHLLHVIVVVGDVLVGEPLDEVLPAHSEVTLVEVDGPVGRVLDVRCDREVEEVVSAVAVLAELVHSITPVKGFLKILIGCTFHGGKQMQAGMRKEFLIIICSGHQDLISILIIASFLYFLCKDGVNMPFSSFF